VAKLTPRAVFQPGARIPPMRNRAEAWDPKLMMETRGASPLLAPN